MAISGEYEGCFGCYRCAVGIESNVTDVQAKRISWV